MRLAGLEHDDKGRTVLVCRGGLFGLQIKKFVAASRIATKFWNWLELPGLRVVPDSVSFQLDEWKEELEGRP